MSLIDQQIFVQKYTIDVTKHAMHMLLQPTRCLLMVTTTITVIIII